jgi:glycosyltransferase involved in cell wall biosynthesis
MTRPGVDGCVSQVVKQRGVRVRRSLVSTDDGTDLLVKFSVESDCEQPVAVRVRDGGVASEHVGIEREVDDADCRWTANDDGVAFSRSIVPGDSFVTGYRLSSDGRAATSGTPAIEVVQPIDEQDAEAGFIPQWRGSGASVGLTDGDGTTVTTATNGARTANSTRTANGTQTENESTDCLVAIPAYNESGAIADVVSQAESHADEVLVVDDGSADATAARARDAGATVVQHERNKGYGAALRRTFREADRRGATDLVIIDGDGQHDPADIPRLLDRQSDTRPQIVIGSRFVGDRKSEIPAYRRLGLWVVNAITNLSMGTGGSKRRVKDTQSGFRAYNAAAITSLADDGAIGDGMGASTDVLYHARQCDFEIEEVGTEISYDVGNASSHNPIAHGLTLVSSLLCTIERDHPIALLGVPGFVSSFVGFGFGYRMISNYVASGSFPLGLAISTTFFLLIGVFACFTAIILHSLNRYFDSGTPVH